MPGEIGEKLKAAEGLLAKLARFSAGGRPSAAPEPERVSPPDPNLVAAAAQAFTERARARLKGLAA